MSREGRWFRNMALQAGLDLDKATITTLWPQGGKALWDQIKGLRPKVVIALGAEVTRLLIGNCKLNEVAGKFCKAKLLPVRVAPWHSPVSQLQGGKAADEATIKFLTKVKEKLLALDQ